jgi:excisionase family DNA binding protein
VLSIDNLPSILTVPEAAKIARVSTGTVYQMVRIEGFPVVRFGRSVRIPRQAFLRWLESQTAC